MHVASRRFNIGSGESFQGPRIGGRPPRGVSASSPNLSYFLTIPYDALELSVFIDASPDFIFGDQAGTLVGEGEHAAFIVHGPSRRGGLESGRSDLSEHPLIVHAATDDLEPCDEDSSRIVPYSGHKLGGLPYFVHGDRSLEKSVRDIMANGFEQILQIDAQNVEGDTPDVEGEWPVGGGLFHVLARRGQDRSEFLCFWEQ